MKVMVTERSWLGVEIVSEASAGLMVDRREDRVKKGLSPGMGFPAPCLSGSLRMLKSEARRCGLVVTLSERVIAFASCAD